MLNAPVRSVFDVITDFLAANPTPEEIIAYRLPEDLQIRAHELLDKNSAGALRSEEYEQMMDFVRIDSMMTLLKAKMKLKLKKAAE